MTHNYPTERHDAEANLLTGADVGVPEAPAHLSEEGERIWVELWTNGAGVYKVSDRLIVERYASLQARRHELLKLIEQEGMLSAGSQGQTIQHPAIRILSDIEAKLLPLEDRLGLSPAARAQLKLTEASGSDRLAEFLKKSRS